MVFPEEGETSEDECTIEREFADHLNKWERLEDGASLHMLMHMFAQLMLQLRQYFTPLDCVLVLNNQLKLVEYVLASRGYMVETEDEGLQRFNGPEFRVQMEQELESTEIPHTVPDWLQDLMDDETTVSFEPDTEWEDEEEEL